MRELREGMHASFCSDPRARLGSSAAGQEKAELGSASGLPVIHLVKIGSASEQWRPGCCKSDD